MAVNTGATLTYGMLSFGDEERMWKPVVDLIDRVNAAGGSAWGQAHSRHFGVLVSFQTRLPFDALPVWRDLRAQPLDEQRRALADPALRARLIDEAEHGEYGRAIGAEARKPRCGTGPGR